MLAATVGSTGLTATYTASTGTLEITGTATNLSISGSAAYGDV